MKRNEGTVNAWLAISRTEPLALPRPHLSCLASQAWPKYDVPAWDAAWAAPAEVAALTPTHSLYLFLFPIFLFHASWNKLISSQPFLFPWSFDFRLYLRFHSVWHCHISHLLCQIAGSLSWWWHYNITLKCLKRSTYLNATAFISLFFDC